jgi:cysteine desulfurase
MGGSGRVYLDWNATAPPHPDVIAAMMAAAAEAWGNPSSVHETGRKARAVVDDARETVARFMGSDARDVFFTSGATEANNLALRSATALVTSRLEHPSVVRVAEALESEGRPVRWLAVPPSGRVDADAVGGAIAGLPSGFTVALMAANHETGVRQPLREVETLVHAAGGLLHVDAVQAAGKLPPSEYLFGDSLSLAAHKLRGPKGVGALVMRTRRVPTPVLLGGAQERGFRPGTVDPVHVAGFAAAVRHAADGGPERLAAVERFRDQLERALSPDALVNGGETARLPHVSNLSFPGYRGDELVAALDLAGVSVSSGSACSAGTQEPSTIIAAMLGKTRAESAVRFSLGETTSEADVLRAIGVLLRVVTRRSSTT